MAQNPYCPTPGADNPTGQITSYIQEVLQLSPAEVRGVGLGLQASLTSSSPVTDQYRVPADQDLVIFSIHAYLAFATLSAEPTAILTFLNPDPSERWFIKAQNCTAALVNVDRSLNVFDARDIRLSAICPPVGSPLYFPPQLPMLVPAGHTLKATFTLQDTTAAIVGGSTVYGLMLTGALIPRDA